MEWIFSTVVDEGWAPWIPMFFATNSALSLQITSAVGTGLAAFVLFLAWLRFRHFEQCPKLDREQMPTRNYGLPCPVPGFQDGRLPPWRIFPKMFDVATVVCLAATLVLAFVFPKQLPEYSNVLLWAPFAGCVWMTFLFGAPFTTQYAKEAVPEAFWETDAFRKLNLILSIVWGVCLTLASICCVVCLDAVHSCGRETSVVLVYVLPNIFLVIAVVFTIWFPSWAQERLKNTQEAEPLQSDKDDYQAVDSSEKHKTDSCQTNQKNGGCATTDENLINTDDVTDECVKQETELAKQ